MAGQHKIARALAWIWNRVSDLSTLSWLWPGGAVVIAVALSMAQELPLAALFVLALAAGLVVLIGVVVWRQHFRPTHSLSGLADPPIGAAAPATRLATYLALDVPPEDHVGRLKELERRHAFIEQRRAILQSKIEEVESEWPQVIQLCRGGGGSPEDKRRGLFPRTAWSLPLQLAEMKVNQLRVEADPDASEPIGQAFHVRVDEHDGQDNMPDEERRLWYRKLAHKRDQSIGLAKAALEAEQREQAEIEAKLKLYGSTDAKQ